MSIGIISRTGTALAIGMIGLAAYAAKEDIVLKLQPRGWRCLRIQGKRRCSKPNRATINFSQKHADKITGSQAGRRLRRKVDDQ